MLILTFEEFKIKYNTRIEAMININREDIGRDISLIPREIKMSDQTPSIICETNFNNIVNQHPTDGKHWVLVIRREIGEL